MNISIIISFRNREMSRIKNAMDSLQKQTCNDFELLFVDYGSDETVSEQAKRLLSNYPFVKYIYSDTRGWFWNRAHALNTGIKMASGNIILISDIDLIFRNDFLKRLTDLPFKNSFYIFKCYYLQYQMNYPDINDDHLKKARVNYVGLCAVLKEHLANIRGFDEYYMNWGGEDDDFYMRLEGSGLEKHKMEVDDFHVLHQWHSNHAPTYPSLWYLDMVNYLYSGQSSQNVKKQELGLLVQFSRRSIIDAVNDYNSFKKFDLYPLAVYQFNLFLEGFFKMAPGDFGRLHFPLQPKVPKGLKQKLVDKFNNQLEKLKLPYYLEKKNVSSPVHTREAWCDFIIYFIGKNRILLQDYYLIDNDVKLVLLFQKK